MMNLNNNLDAQLSYEDLNQKCVELTNQINSLNNELSKEKQINNTTKEYIQLLESKIVEFDNQKKIIKTLHEENEKLKKESIEKDNKINLLKQELDSSKLMESYITKLLDLKNDLNNL